jgi:hypothetical protein
MRTVAAAMRGECKPPDWYCYEPLPGEGSPVVVKRKRPMLSPQPFVRAVGPLPVMIDTTDAERDRGER